MLATVLITVVAATVALGVVFSAVLTTRAEADRTDYGRAATAADKVRADFERQLAADPQFYLSHMFAYERPRKCLADASTSDIARTLAANPYLTPVVGGAAPAWPLDVCGGVWDYPPSGTTRVQTIALQLPAAADGTTRTWSDTSRVWNASDNLVRAEVRPNPATGQVTLTVLAQVGAAEAGQQVTYGTPTVAEWTLWSGSGLDLTQLMHPVAGTPSADAVLAAGASAYSGGVLRVGAYGVSMSSATLAGEGGVVAAPPTAAVLSGTIGAGAFDNPPSAANTSPIRTAVPAPLTSAALGASAAGLDMAGCGSTVGTAQNLSTRHRTSLLCLRPGQKVITTAGAQVTVPQAAMMLLVPTGAGSDDAGLRVYTADAAPVAEGSCLLAGCQPSAMDARGAAAGTHIQSPLAGSAPWKLLGDFYYPSTGVVATGTDTVVGRCPQFATVGAANCGTDPGEPGDGWTFRVPLTVWAGTAASPADLWIAGPVRAAADAKVGLVASGRVVFPAFASPNGVVLPVAAQVAALGLGPAASSPIVGWPAGYTAPSLQVALTGSMASPALGRIGTVASLSVTPGWTAGTRPAPAPHLPGFTQIPVTLMSRTVSGSEVCGTTTGAAGVGTVANCSGRW